MKRFRYLLLLLLFLAACSSRKTASNNNNSKESLSFREAISSKTTDHYDALSYIGKIERFRDNNTFGTDIGFSGKISEDDYHMVEQLGDSVIFRDDGVTRTRIPIDKAGKYFNLTGLGRISIYDMNNRKTASGKFSHIELVADMIESRFVAVFSVDNKNISGYKYCTGASLKEFPPISSIEFNDPELTTELIDFLHLKKEECKNIGHYKLSGSNTIYSTLSADTTAFITESVDRKIKVLYKSRSSQIIMGIFIISKTINGHPILLVDGGLPASDFFWSAAMAFNGKEYVPIKDQRLKSDLK